MQEVPIALAWCFLHVINLTDDAFERLGRYEAALWRQVRQTLFSLEGCVWAVPPSVIDARTIDGLLSQTWLLVGTSQKALVTDSVQVPVKGNRIRHKRGVASSKTT